MSTFSTSRGGGGLGEHPNVRRHSSLCGAPLQNAYGPLAGTCPMSRVNEAMMLVESITLLAGHTASMARQLAGRAVTPKPRAGAIGNGAGLGS
jgi:hypothetical protein